MHNLEQDIHNLAWRHYRRHFGRESAYPSYPAHSSRHVTFHYRTPEVEQHRHQMIPPFFTFNVDLQREFERMEMEIQQNDNNEQTGLSQHELDTLPSYHVTKKTLEEFSDKLVFFFIVCDLALLLKICSVIESVSYF